MLNILKSNLYLKTLQMKLQHWILCFIVLSSFLSCEESTVTENQSSNLNPEGFTSEEFYQIKTYTFDNGEQEKITDQYLKEAYLPALKRQGLSNIGVFKPRANSADTTNKTYILIPFLSLNQFSLVEEKLAKDQTYLKAGSAYLTSLHDKPPYQRIESTLLKAFVEMPTLRPVALDGPRADRVYELRSYESATEDLYQKKVDMFNAGGEVALFEQLEFNAVFYAEVISGSKMPNLMYMTTFSDLESRDAHWKAFVDAPKWKEISALPKYQNTVSHADVMLLYPTEYSDY
jgi:NIPSNAP protein